MKIQRTKNAGRNIVFGTVLKVYNIVIPFLMRTLMIYQMGMEYAGLNNLFSSLFQVLNIAELGIGAALTFSMYEPIAKDESEKISALLNLYRKCFQIIGGIIFALGLLCMPFLKYLVNGNVPDNLNLQHLYFLYLLNTVLSYWLFSYKKSLIYAFQRNDINSKISLVTYSIQYFLQALVILKLHNYYLYVISSIAAQILLNLISAMVVDKTYPYKPVGKVESVVVVDIKKKVQGLVTNKIGGVIFRSADSIIISAFLGLVVLAQYQNYYYILSAVISIFTIIFEACVAGIGNSIITERKEKNYEDFCTLTFLTGILIGICCACFICLYQPFIQLWVGDENLLSISLIISFVIYFYVYEVDQLISTYKDAAGIWYQDRYRPLLSAILNLTLNIITIRFLGLYGVLYSTIISYIVLSMPWLLFNVFHELFFGMSVRRYILLLLKNIFATLLACVASYLICSKININGLQGLVIRLILTVGISGMIMIAVLFKSREFPPAYKLVRKLIKLRK